MIEQKIDELISALSANTAALKLLAAGPAEGPAPRRAAKAAEAAPAAPATPAPPAVPPKPAAPAISDADIRAVAQKLLDLDRLADIQAINAKFGLKKITLATDEQRPQVLAELQAAVAKASASSDAV